MGGFLWVLYQGELFHSRHGFAEPSLISMAEDHHCPWIGSCQTPKTSNGMERVAQIHGASTERKSRFQCRESHKEWMRTIWEANTCTWFNSLMKPRVARTSFLEHWMAQLQALVGETTSTSYFWTGWGLMRLIADFPDCFMAMSCFMVTTWCTRLPDDASRMWVHSIWLYSSNFM